MSDPNNQPVSERELDWVERYYDTLLDQYEGEWILVKDDRVVAHHSRLRVARDMCFAKGVMDPFCKFMASPSDDPIIPAVTFGS